MVGRISTSAVLQYLKNINHTTTSTTENSSMDMKALSVFSTCAILPKLKFFHHQMWALQLNWAPRKELVPAIKPGPDSFEITHECGQYPQQ
jgi:hypothetical protein